MKQLFILYSDSNNEIDKELFRMQMVLSVSVLRLYLRS